jgi:hypothetical protein
LNHALFRPFSVLSERPSVVRQIEFLLGEFGAQHVVDPPLDRRPLVIAAIDGAGQFDKTGPEIAASGTVSFTTYNGFGEAASQWAGTTTAATPAARSAVIAAFRSWLASTQSQGQTSYSAGGTQLYLVSSSVYNLDGGATATTEYVDSNSAHNRTTAGLRRNKGDIHQRNKGDIHQIQVA